MKKLIICSVLSVALLFAFTPSVQAKQKLFELPIPVWFSQAIKPFQNTLKALTGRVDNHETRIVELEKKVADLEEKIRQIENRWITNQPVNTGELIIEGGSGNTLINPNGSQEEINIGSQGELNIGSQGSNTDNLYILNPPNTSDVNLSNQP